MILVKLTCVNQTMKILQVIIMAFKAYTLQS